MTGRLIGVFTDADAAERAARDLRMANFSPAPAAPGQVPGADDLGQSGGAALVVDPAGREPEARAIMMRAGVERLISEAADAPAHSSPSVGSPDVDAYLREHPAPSVAGKDPGSPIPDPRNPADRHDSEMVADPDAPDSPMREINIQSGDREIEDKMRRGAAERNSI